MDVSSSLRSRARRILTSVATLGLVRTPSGMGDVGATLGQLNGVLESGGFRVLRVLNGSGTMRPDGADAVMILLRGTEARLHREFYREQLDAWIQSRISARAEFTPHEAPAAGFTPARRVGLLHQPLIELLPRLRTELRADLSVGGVFPPHHRRFSATLLAHLCRRPLLQAQHLHSLRNEYGEKIAFLFAFRNHHQRWLRVPAVLGVLLWLSRLLSVRLPALLTPIFGLAIPLWASLLLEVEKRYT